MKDSIKIYKIHIPCLKEPILCFNYEKFSRIVDSLDLYKRKKIWFEVEEV